MEFRKVFDRIPDDFDKGRLRYCDEAFADIIQYAELSPEKSVLEIGPGTGQATEPILKTGCNYLAIEIGEHPAKYTINKFKKYSNFHLVNDDFITYDFGDKKFDFIYSAATIQWIPEEVAFTKVHSLLKEGGTFAMMLTHSDEKTANEALYEMIQEVYQNYFYPEERYTRHLEYSNIKNYGFTNYQVKEYHKKRQLNANQYISWISTHAEHITLKEPYKTQFYDGIRDAITSFENKIVINDTIVLYLCKKL